MKTKTTKKKKALTDKIKKAEVAATRIICWGWGEPVPIEELVNKVRVHRYDNVYRVEDGSTDTWLVLSPNKEMAVKFINALWQIDDEDDYAVTIGDTELIVNNRGDKNE